MNWKNYEDRQYRFYLQKWTWYSLFQHDMAYGKSKDLTKRTQLDKVLREKAFKIASDQR